MLDVQVEPDAAHAGRAAAGIMVHAALAAISERDRAVLAASGGRSVGPFLRGLGQAHLPWSEVHVVQVDERAVAPDHEARNRRAQLAALTELPPEHFHGPELAGEADDLDVVAAGFEEVVAALGPPDCVHLGLGPDGHTASLVPGDPVLEARGRLVAPTAAPYQGHRRITLTFEALARARSIVWLVTGSDKAPILARLVAGDPAIPASRVPAGRAIVVCDQDAATGLGTMAP